MKIAITSNSLCDEHIETRYFRILLEAFGYPARVCEMGTPALEAVLLALCDEKSPVALEGAAQRVELQLRNRHVPVVERDQAQFIVCDAQSLDWKDVPIGSREAPEEGATLIIEVRDLCPYKGAVKLSAKGAGVKDVAEFWVDRESALKLQQRPSFEYPCGVDLLLICGSSVVALPRHLMWELS